MSCRPNKTFANTTWFTQISSDQDNGRGHLQFSTASTLDKGPTCIQ